MLNIVVLMLYFGNLYSINPSHAAVRAHRERCDVKLSDSDKDNHVNVMPNFPFCFITIRITQFQLNRAHLKILILFLQVFISD